MGTKSTQSARIATVGVALTVMVALAIGLALINASASASAPTAPLSDFASTQARLAAQAAHAPDCGPNWDVVPSPNVGTGDNGLRSIAAITSSDVWAVGYYYTGTGYVTLAEHWDGSVWSAVPSPNLGTSNNALDGVAAVSSTDVWAVGHYSNGSVDQTLAEHWNGSVWSVVSIPNVGTFDNYLNGVSTVSSSDVWAVGYYQSQGIARTLTVHWDGSAWSVVPSPNVGTGDNLLNGVAVVSSGDVWAVGNYHTGNVYQTLTEHWQGSTWSVVSSPSPGGLDDRLNDVAVVSSSDVWAVGTYDNDPVYQTLIEHWDGSAWSVVSSPNVGTQDNLLNGVAVVSSSDMWAVGNYWSGIVEQTLVLHNGTVIPSPNVDTDNYLYGVAVVSSSDMWAVGTYYNGSGVAQTLVEGYNPCLGSPTTTPTPTPALTNTPVNTPTNTPAVTTTNTPAAATATSSATPTLVATATPCSLQFEYVPSPNPGSGTSILKGVAVVSADDVWAVGYYNSVTAVQTLIEHWDGIQWSIMASPNGPSGGSFLEDVAAVSPNDVWAVGYWGSFTFASQTLIEHWNGVQWSIVPSPNLGADANSLMGIAAVGPNDIWAVGFSGQYLAYNETMTMRWNGSLWSIVPSPSPGSNYNELYGVAAVSANDVWAVGSYGGPVDQTLAEHWNGTVWNVVSSPNPFGSYGSGLVAVAAVSTNDVWAVGGYITDPYLGQTLTEHWNGTVWSVVPSPSPGSGSYGSDLNGVAVVSANDVWAVGDYRNNGSPVQTLTEHWNGTVWSVVPSPNPGSDFNRLFGAAVVSANDVWAVGDYHDQTLVERYSPCPSSPTPTVTGTPPTSTPSPTTAPLASPTVCPIQFTDVPVGSTFYSYIRCLACRGIINGYPDNTFRPNNDVTRGQLSKIISNAAGFIDPQTTQMFQDVPVGSTFFIVIGRLASRGYIGGYPCGGAGETCVPPGNLPYFRPNANATRGQISKIDSNAEGYSDTPTGRQFEDVPPGSTYYTYTYRLVSRSIMAGYACGGTGQPCVPPANRPYFRPNNNATRGQTSKIVANTFFPDCQTPATR